MVQEDAEFQYEDEEEALMSNPGAGIGWFLNTKFYGVDTQPLFEYHCHTKSTRKQGGDNITTTSISL